MTSEPSRRALPDARFRMLVVGHPRPQRYRMAPEPSRRVVPDASFRMLLRAGSILDRQVGDALPSRRLTAAAFAATPADLGTTPPTAARPREQRDATSRRRTGID